MPVAFLTEDRKTREKERWAGKRWELGEKKNYNLNILHEKFYFQ